MEPRQLAVGVIALVTLAAVMLRPRGAPEAISALAGGVLVVLVGAVQPIEAAQLLLAAWNVFAFFLGLMLIAAAADHAGVFDVLAWLAARAAGGSRSRLLLNLFVLGAGLTAVLSNDATALILTPVVYTLTLRLGLPTRPYAFACTFIADTASFLLPVSNPINILVLERFPTSLGDYLHHLLPAALAAIAVNVAVFLWLFRAELAGGFAPTDLPPPAVLTRAPQRFRLTALGLGVLAGAYLYAAWRGWPLGLVALVGGAALLGGAVAWGEFAARGLASAISWGLFGFIAGFLVLVQGVENAGLSAGLGHALAALAGDDPLRATAAAVVLSALGANLVNNVPAALLQLAAIDSLPSSPVRGLLAYGTLVGADLGPNLTTVGSLATMLWLLLLRQRGVTISSLEYFRVGLITTPGLLAAATLALWGMGR
ncbi:MAG: arsenic transporter [Chloroflexi bacterium]|nr:arsenic transporter [Chloroflexota bacterium]